MIVTETNLSDVKLYRKGKVRDVYDLGDKLLIVATDRISAFDVIIPTPIPEKGKVLTQISKFWFDYTKDIVPNHMISFDTKDLPANIKETEQLEDRMMLTKKCEVVPFECVVRGYLAGSGWKEYQKDQSVCGIKLPTGLKESSKIEEPIFTPATKADEGHDMNVSFEYMANEVGEELSSKLRDLSIAIYTKAREYALTKGIIIADTKFEFGLLDGEIILIDEVLTPDSSRFWPKDKYAEGRGQESFDKQFVRDYLASITWDKTPPAPQLPDEIVNKTREKYLDILKILVVSRM